MRFRLPVTSRPTPVPADAPLPHRKEIRSWLKPFTERKTLLAIALLVVDWAVFAALIAGSIFFTPWWAKLICAVAAGIAIGRLFIIGHDACHHSYTSHRQLNRVLGRLAMLPSLTPYSLWQVGHNVVHHGYTNLKGVDFVWAPLTLEEYQNLTPTRRLLERIYRSGWGPCLYYLIEMWWLRMFFPSKGYIATRRPEFFWDSALAAVTAVVWIGGLVSVAAAVNQSPWLLIFYGFVIPFLVWNALIGFVVYVHHTHSKVRWHKDKKAWAAAAPFVSTTVHLTFPLHFGALFHHIMEHTAHHVDMSIPLYELKDAQDLLEDVLPERIVKQRFSWRWYFDTARQCKLFDFEKDCWTDFGGQEVNFNG